MMTVDSSHSTHTTLCNVWLSTSGTTEVAKNWTTALSKVGTSQRCGSCSKTNKQTNKQTNELCYGQINIDMNSTINSTLLVHGQSRIYEALLYNMESMHEVEQWKKAACILLLQHLIETYANLLVALYSRLLNTLSFWLLFSNKPHTENSNALNMLELHTTLYYGVWCHLLSNQWHKTRIYLGCIQFKLWHPRAHSAWG